MLINSKFIRISLSFISIFTIFIVLYQEAITINSKTSVPVENATLIEVKRKNLASAGNSTLGVGQIGDHNLYFTNAVLV